MEVILIHIITCFLLAIGAIAIIGSITAINKKHKENETAFETKWFKWQAPIRLVFGLVCFTMIFLYTQFDNSSEIIVLEKENKKLTQENIVLQNNKVTSDTSNRFSIIIYDNTGKSFFKGQILISVRYNDIRIKGSELYDINRKNLGNIITVSTGDRYFIKVSNSYWGINILKIADVNSDEEHYIEVELYNTFS